MAMKKLKTVGIDRETGLSRLAVTPKKKSKMKKIVPAIVATAALAAGVGAFGGTSAAGGGSFFSKFVNGVKSFFGGSKAAVGTIATSAMDAAYKTPSSVPGVGSDSFSLGSLFDTVSKGASWTFGKIKGMDAMDLYIGGKALEVAGNLLSDDEDFTQQNFEAQLAFDYDELAVRQEIAMAEIAAKNRQTAGAGTFAGFTSPVVMAEGVTTEKGYTPPRMPAPPTGTGGLLS